MAKSYQEILNFEYKKVVTNCVSKTNTRLITTFISKVNQNIIFNHNLICHLELLPHVRLGGAIWHYVESACNLDFSMLNLYCPTYCLSQSKVNQNIIYNHNPICNLELLPPCRAWSCYMGITWKAHEI